MVKISAVVITFNEENNIVPLLNNIYPLFEEIVIVDGVSTDKTTKYIEEYKKLDSAQKIKLYLFAQNCPRYSPRWKQSVQRNLALQRATGDWLFTLDADERLDADVRARLDRLLKEYPKSIAWAFPTYDYWETPDQIRVDGWWFPNYHYRFWKNGQKISYSRHSRHCFPIILGHYDVRKLKEVTNKIPCVNDIKIHHYHHCPIKKMIGGGYRANFKDVKNLQDLQHGLEVRKVEPRKLGSMEKENG